MKKEIDGDVLKSLYYDEELSVTEVAERLGVAWHNVYNYMDRYGLKRRSRSEAQKLRFKKNYTGPAIDEILRLYFDEELSSFQVAERVGLSQSTVRDRIEKAGYSLRTVKESHSVRKVGRILITFSPEDQETIRFLYCDEKRSMGVIAIRFNVSPQIIKRTLLQMGVELRTLQESQQIRRDREQERYEKRVSKNVGKVLDASEVSVAKVVELYQAGELLLDEVALKCSLPRVEVYEILKEAGLLPDYSK